jgi:tetratricopeptide (TPR) repeat protein
LARAEQLYQQALAIYEKLAPNSLDVATTLQNLTILARRQKNYPQAQRYLARALAIYETQRTAVQDPETKTAFAERNTSTPTPSKPNSPSTNNSPSKLPLRWNAAAPAPSPN